MAVHQLSAGSPIKVSQLLAPVGGGEIREQQPVDAIGATGGTPPSRTVQMTSFNLDTQRSGTAFELFAQLAALRLAAVADDGRVHAAAVSPTDFIATHRAFWVDDGTGSVRVIGGSANLPVERADTMGLPLPIVALVRMAKSDVHLTALDAILEEHRRTGWRLTYSSDLVVAPQIRRSRISAAVLELTAAVLYSELTTGGVATDLTCGNDETLRFFKRTGYVRVEMNGRPSTPLVADDGTALYLLRLSTPSDYARTCFEKHRSTLTAGS